jgi:hypothetical protein
MAAEGIVPGAPQVVYGGGFINGYLWGAPIDLWIGSMMLAVFVPIIIYFMWRIWWVCPPVNGYFRADRKGEPLGIKFSKNMKLKMLPLKYAAQIFEPDEENIAETEKWKQNLAQSIGQLGVVNTAIICDWHDWVENPIINQAIMIAAEEWNKQNPTDRIYDYVTFSKKLYDGSINRCHPEGIKVPPYFIVDVVRVEQYMPKQRDAASFGGWLRREAAALNRDQSKPNLMPFYVMTGAGVAIFLASLVFSYIILKR